MRLWSLHPQHLDPAGLVALWREALLAQAVLAGRTRGYTRHTQLERFRDSRDPCGSIAQYLTCVADEADRRGYSFDRSRIAPPESAAPNKQLEVSDGQLAYEWQHLKRKLWARNRALYRAAKSIDAPRPHPLFRVVPGGVAEWEKQ